MRTNCTLFCLVLLTLTTPVFCRAQDEGPLPALQQQQSQSNAQANEADPADASSAASRTRLRELDNAAIVRMTKADVGDSIITQTIRTQPGNFHTGPDDLIALKDAGVSQTVISAMLARNSGLAQRPDPKPVEVTPLSPDVDDPGLYFKNKQGQWEPVSPELVKYRDGGALKSVFTNNIIKKDLNGQVSGPKSSLQIAPGTEMMILAPRLSDAVEYVILRFRTHSDRREFRVKTGNVFHSETGADRDQLDIPIHKVASRIFSFTVPSDIAKGEYGVLPPGNASTPGIVYAGKMYTFRVDELEAASLHYLLRLWEGGYFKQQHLTGGYTWCNDEPACRNDAVFDQVRAWLVARRLVRVDRLDQKRFNELKVHPKEWPDCWSFEPTHDGEHVIQTLDIPSLNARASVLLTALDDARRASMGYPDPVPKLPRLRRRTLYSLLAALVLVVALAVILFLRFHAPPEVARLLPESDAIAYLNLKPVRAATHFDEKPVEPAPDYAQFVNAAGFRWERDLDRIAIALHRMPDPRGPNGPVAYSAVAEGRFDAARLSDWLQANSRAMETYSGHTIYTVPGQEGRTLRIAPLGFDLVAASNMPTTEQIHSMLDRYGAGASPFSGSSVLTAHYHDVPYFSPAWGIGHVALPFSENGHVQVFGVPLPLSEDTDLVASVTYRTTLHLRVEDFAPSEGDAAQTTTNLQTILNLLRAFVPDGGTANQQALHRAFASAQVEQRKGHVLLNADIPLELVRANAGSR